MCCRKKKSDLARNLLPRISAGVRTCAAEENLDFGNVICCRGCRAGVRNYVRLKEIRIWYVICCCGCWRRPDYAVQRKQDLARNFVAADAYGCPELRAVSEPKPGRHVICCRGCSTGVRDYGPFQKKRFHVIYCPLMPHWVSQLRAV